MQQTGYASHCAALGDMTTMVDTLHSLMRDPKTPIRKHVPLSPPDDWKIEMQQYGYGKNCYLRKVLKIKVLPRKSLMILISYNCTSYLFLRERIEAIDLLFETDIKENRDVELYSHTSALHYQIGMIYNALYYVITHEGAYSAFTGIVVGNAIAAGAYNALRKLRDSVTTLSPGYTRNWFKHGGNQEISGSICN